MSAGFAGFTWLETDPRPLDWNGPVDRPFRRFPDEDLASPVIQLFERVAHRSPDAVAVSDAEGTLTFGELWARVRGLGQAIAARTEQGALVGLLLPAARGFPVAMLGCLAAGRPFLALDPDQPGNWLADLLLGAGPALVVCDGDVPSGVAGVVAENILRLDDPVPPVSPDWRPAALGPDEPACVLFTSGSTGRPKGVANSQRGLLQRVGQAVNAAHIDADDRFLTLASPATIVGVRDVLTALLAGARIHLADVNQLGARETREAIRGQGITILFAFPALLRTLIARRDGRLGEALRLVRIGGDTILWSDVDAVRAQLPPGAAIQSIYAATEAPMMQWFVDPALRGADDRVPIGYPLPGNRLSIVGEDGRPAATGEVGELVVQSPYVALGVWSGGRLIAPEGELDARLVRTGDLVRQRSDGLVERIGRKDRQVKIRGIRVELEGVEAVLRRHPFVRDVGALARQVGSDGETVLVAHVSARDGAPADLLEALRSTMGEAPAPMRPARLYLAQSIPRLASSKLDVAALRAMDETQRRAEDSGVAGAAAAESPGGDRTARTVARVWRETLRAPVGGSEDDFFEGGGDSLKAIILVMGLEAALGLELPLTLIYEAPRFGALCQALSGRAPARGGPLVLLKAGQGALPVFFVPGAGGHVAELFAIARGMAYPGPVYGLQAKGLDGREAPFATVEEMAGAYLEAIRARQPKGPYQLCGYSFGGLVAFEMARRLREAGEEVGLVGLFDTVMSSLGWPLGAWPAQLAGGVKRLASNLADAARGRRTGVVAGGREAPGLSRFAPAGVLRVTAAALLASARHRPGRYRGEVTLFAPAGRDRTTPTASAAWRARVDVLNVVRTPGTHLSMLSGDNGEAAAAALTRCLAAS